MGRGKLGKAGRREIGENRKELNEREIGERRIDLNKREVKRDGTKKDRAVR